MPRVAGSTRLIWCSMSKGKKRKQDDEDEPVTYINDRNKVFNKKVSPKFCIRF